MLPDRCRRLLPFLLALGVLLLFGLPWLALYRSQHRAFALVVSTGQPGGVYNPLAEAIATAVSKNHSRLTFDLRTSDGSVMSMRRLEGGECDLALLQNGTPGGDDIRVIVPLYDEVLHILVPADSSAQRLRDLRGQRLAVGPKESGTQQIVKRLFEHYGLDEGEFEPVFTDMSTACKKLLAVEPEVDAVFVVAGVRAEAIQETMASGRVRLMGIGDPDQVGNEVDGLKLHYPNINSYTIPANTYRSDNDEQDGQPNSPVQTLTVPSLLVCRSDLPHRVVTQITQSIFENRAALIRKHPAAGRIREPADTTELSFPLHAGAAAYYQRHEPSFLVEYAEVIALILSVAITVMGGIVAVRKWLLLRKKDRIDGYYVQIEEIINQLEDDADLDRDQLRAMERELSRLRQQAVQQLVSEQLRADESFRIFQTLLATSQAEVRRKIERL